MATEAPLPPAPVPITDPAFVNSSGAIDIAALKASLLALNNPAIKLPPDNTLRRYARAGIDLSAGYPYFPPKPATVQDVYEIRKEQTLREYVDPEKKSLFGAAKEVRQLTTHIGTEIVGLQLKDLTDQQKDELALLIAERSVVFFRDQDISPQAQQELGLYLGQGEIERHPQAAQVPGVGGGISLIWQDGRKDGVRQTRSYRVPYGSGSHGWHTDLVHEAYPPGYTHLHQDTIPELGGDTLWASGYAAYDKLSPAFKKIVDGLHGVYRSLHKYPDATNPSAEPQPVTRTHPLVRTHPVTGWKSLYLNRMFTIGIDGFDAAESAALLNYLFDVYERSLDIQLRWRWTPGTSAIWDNRITIHSVSYDYEGERHGTRVSSLAERPFFDEKSKSRAEALGLEGWLDVKDFKAFA